MWWVIVHSQLLHEYLRLESSMSYLHHLHSMRNMSPGQSFWWGKIIPLIILSLEYLIGPILGEILHREAANVTEICRGQKHEIVSWERETDFASLLRNSSKIEVRDFTLVSPFSKRVLPIVTDLICFERLRLPSASLCTKNCFSRLVLYLHTKWEV